MPRLVALCLLISLATTASANAAMGLGLEMFSMETWTIYVIATLIFEAWFIGRFFKRSWPASLGISVLANGITGFCCINLGAVFLHQVIVGSRLNPNPFLNAVVLFTGFGVVSGLIESIVWALFRVDRNAHNSLMWRSLLAHLIGVPLGLSILLIPSHPYLGVVRSTNSQRWHYVEQRLSRDLNQILAGGDPLPCAKTIPDLLAHLPATGRTEPDEHAACYEADLSRFSMGSDRSKPIGELNPAICGYKAPKAGEPPRQGTIWIIRRRDPSWTSGLVIDRETGEVRRTLDPTELGYTR
ncbi:MAG: hypothetical protein ACHQ50_10815 [Fimbriimonadales bacterium]